MPCAALAATSGGSAALRGGAVGLLYGNGKMIEEDLVGHLRGHLHSSREDGADGPNFLRGLLKTARSLLWQAAGVLASIHEVVKSWDEERFVKLLPLVRLALADLTPRETDLVAKRVAALLGAESLKIASLPDIDSGQMLRLWRSTACCARRWPRTDWRCFVSDAPLEPERISVDANAGDAQRWRLISGRFAQPRLGSCGGADSKQAHMDRALDYLYGREYRGRGVRGKGGTRKGRAGSFSDSRTAATKRACFRSRIGSGRSASFFPRTPPRSSNATRWTAMA